MYRKIRNIALFILGLAGLIFFLHSVIPHQHHYYLLPGTHQEAENHSGNSPQACHAFNDLAIDKLTILTNDIPVRKMFPVVFVEITDYISIEGRQNRSVFFPGENKKVPSDFYLTSSPARGSPVLS